MDFEKLLEAAKAGDKGAKERLFLMYRGLLLSRSKIDGKFSEDLFQELSRTFLLCIDRFCVDEVKKRLNWRSFRELAIHLF